MTTFAKLTFGLAIAAACLFQVNLSAGDKKKDGDKKAAPDPDIVINGELINADLKDKVHMQSYCKTYTFKMEKGKSYHIEVASTNFQSLLRLEDSTGKQVAQVIDPFGNQKAVLFHSVSKTEDHEIIVTTPNGGSTGKFTLRIKDATHSTVLSIADKLDQNDKQYAPAGNKKHKMYFVNFEEGRTYQIDMTSPNFDSYLYLESPEGKVLAQDDDGGGYPSARIIHKATKTGKYRVVTTYFGGGANGAFNLTVRQTDGPPPTMVQPKDGDKK